MREEGNWADRPRKAGEKEKKEKTVQRKWRRERERKKILQKLHDYKGPCPFITVMLTDRVPCTLGLNKGERGNPGQL